MTVLDIYLEILTNFFKILYPSLRTYMILLFQESVEIPKDAPLSPPPPTSGTPYQKVLRAHYTPQQRKSGHVVSSQLPDPEK